MAKAQITYRILYLNIFMNTLSLIMKKHSKLISPFQRGIEKSNNELIDKTLGVYNNPKETSTPSTSQTNKDKKKKRS